MTGFLDRLAARCTGSADSAAPRVPARFEPAGSAEPEPSMATPEPVAAVATPRVPTQSTASAPAVAPTVRVVHSDPAAVAVPTVRDTGSRPGRRIDAPVAASTSHVIPEAAPGEALANAVVPEVNPAPPGPFPAASVVPVAPARPAPPVPPAVVAAPAVPMTAQPPDVVHVSIGRVEIRTGTPPAAPAKAADTRRAEVSAASLSLTDYLRGERVRP